MTQVADSADLALAELGVQAMDEANQFQTEGGVIFLGLLLTAYSSGAVAGYIIAKDYFSRRCEG